MREGTDTGEKEIVGRLRPAAPYAFNRPSSANFLRGFLREVLWSISPRKQNALLRVSISCDGLICIDGNGANHHHPVVVIDDALHMLDQELPLVVKRRAVHEAC